MNANTICDYFRTLYFRCMPLLKRPKMLFVHDADRLQIVTYDGRNAGGWSLQPAADRIEEVLDKERKSK